MIRKWILAGLAAVAGVLLSCFFPQQSAWADCEVSKNHQIKWLLKITKHKSSTFELLNVQSKRQSLSVLPGIHKFILACLSVTPKRGHCAPDKKNSHVSACII